MAGVYNSLVSNMYPEMNLGGAVTSDKILEFWSEFKGKMNYLMTEMNDDKDTITWEGVNYNENGVGFQTAIQTWQDEQAAAFGILTSAMGYEQQLEKTLNQSI
jgi:hypothetical protein